MTTNLEITVKTLDSQNHKFDVSEELTVKEFKETIADVVKVAVESQRLIYCGRVLQNEKKLSEYGLDKKVVHLVQKLPPSQNRPQSGGSGATTSSRTTTGSARRTGSTTRTGPDGSMYLGALAFPSDIFSVQGTHDIIHNATQSRLTLVQNMLRRVENCLLRLEDPNQANLANAAEASAASAAAEDAANVSSDDERTFEADLETTFTTSVNTHEHVTEVPGDATADAVAGAVSSAIAGALSAIVSAAVGNSMGAPNITIVQGNHSSSHAGPTSAAQSTQTPAASESTGAAPSTSAPEATTTRRTPANGSGQPSVRRLDGDHFIPLSTLSNILDEVGVLQDRLRPLMQRMSHFLRCDPVLPYGSRVLAEAQGRFSLFSETLHSLSHAFHSLSDLSVGLGRPPPRQVGVRSLVLQPTAVVQGFPIQAQINVMTNRISPPSSGSNTSSPTRQTVPPRSQPSVPTTTTSTPSSTATAPPSATAQPQRQGARPFTLSPGGNLELIMEVGPSGITFEHASSPPHTSSSSETPGMRGQAAAAGNVPPPELIQNIMQAMAAQMMGGGRLTHVTQLSGRAGAVGTPAATAAAATTTSNGTTSAGGAGNQASAPGQTSQARGNTATHPTTATQTRSTSRPHVHLAPVNWPGPQSFDPYLPCNSHHIQQPSIRRQFQVVQGPSTHVHRVHVPPQQRSGAQPNLTGLTNPASILSVAQHIFGDGFEHGLLNMQAGHTVADFLTSLPDYTYTQGESFFTDLFFTIAQHLTFRDLLQVGTQNNTPLNRLRQPLRTFVNDQLLAGETATSESMARAVDRLMVEVQPYLEVVVSINAEETPTEATGSSQLRQDIDFQASIRQFGLARIPELIRFIINEEGDPNQFGAQLVERCAQFVRDLASLTLICCHGRRQGLERILHRYMQVLTGDLGPLVQQWTTVNLRLPVRSFVEGLSTAPEGLDAYLVRSQPFAPIPVTATGAVPDESVTPLQPLANQTSDQEEAMDCEEEFVLALEEPVQAVAPSAPPAVTADTDMAASVAPSAGLPLPRMEVDTSCDVAVGSEEWHTGINPDWVPVITRDMQRQRRQQSEQPPFSDAYLSGMSSKRRKLISSSKPQGTVSQVISESLTQAAGAAGVTTTEHLARAAGADTGLQEAYKEEVKKAVSQQLASNPDFTPDRFPNANKYFNPPK